MVCVVFCLPYFYSPTKISLSESSAWPQIDFKLKNFSTKERVLEESGTETSTTGSLTSGCRFWGQDFGLVFSRCSSTGCMKTDGKYKDKPAAIVQTVELAGVQPS